MSTNEISFIHYTDVHLMAGNPPSRIGSYREDILDKLRHIAELSVQHKVDFTVCGGDLFHHKKPASTPHSLVVDTTEVLNSTGVPNYIVPGNHDIQYDNMETIPEQPLGVLIQSGTLRQMKDQVVQKGNLKVKLWSHPFDEQPDLSVAALTDREDIDTHILGIHIYSAPVGGKLFSTRVYSYDDLGATGHDVYLLGHYHADNGAVHSSDYGPHEQLFVNIGSLSRGDYGDENIARQPQCCLVKVTKKGTKTVVTSQVIPVRCKQASEVFDLEKKEKLESQKQETATFVQELQDAASRIEADTSVEEDLKELVSEKEIYDMVLHYINIGHQSAVGSKK